MNVRRHGGSRMNKGHDCLEIRPMVVIVMIVKAWVKIGDERERENIEYQV